MGKYQEIKGNLIELTKAKEFDVIAHGANCFQTMGAGIALQIRKHFPEAFQVDLNDRRESRERLGDLTYAVNPLSGTYIVNLYSQYEGGPNLDHSYHQYWKKVFHHI